MEMQNELEEYVASINEEFIDACKSGCKCAVLQILLLNRHINFKTSFESAFKSALINRHKHILKILYNLNNNIILCLNAYKNSQNSKISMMYPINDLDIYYLNKHYLYIGLPEQLKIEALYYERNRSHICEIELIEYTIEQITNVPIECVWSKLHLIREQLDTYTFKIIKMSKMSTLLQLVITKTDNTNKKKRITINIDKIYWNKKRRNTLPRYNTLSYDNKTPLHDNITLSYDNTLSHDNNTLQNIPTTVPTLVREPRVNINTYPINEIFGL